MRWTSMVKSIGFQFRSHRKHLARFVFGLTHVCDSLHWGQTKINLPSVRRNDQRKCLNKWLKSTSFRSLRKWGRVMMILS